MTLRTEMDRAFQRGFNAAVSTPDVPLNCPHLFDRDRYRTMAYEAGWHRGQAMVKVWLGSRQRTTDRPPPPDPAWKHKW